MAVYQATPGAKITAANWNTIYNLLKGVVGGEDTIRLAGNVADTLLLQPNADPASVVDLFRIKTQAGVEKYALRSDGALCLADQGAEVGSLKDGLMWRNGAKFYGRLDGATVELFTPAATVRLTADRVNDTTSFADATGLSFAVAANKDYFFDALVLFKTVATTTGLALSMNGPASPTSFSLMGQLPNSATDYTVVKHFYVRAYDTPTDVGVGAVGADLVNCTSLKGILRNGANAGTLTVRFKSEVAGSAITICIGSILRWQQLN